jgi:hypothetical protein
MIGSALYRALVFSGYHEFWVGWMIGSSLETVDSTWRKSNKLTSRNFLTATGASCSRSTSFQAYT